VSDKPAVWLHYCYPPMQLAQKGGYEPELPPGEAWRCSCERWYGSFAATEQSPARWERLMWRPGSEPEPEIRMMGLWLAK